MFATTACLAFFALLPQADLETVLAFEAAHEGDRPQGWGGGPAETIFLDGSVVHGGDWAVRIERTEKSSGKFSSATKGIPVDFGGSVLELRGYLRTEDVTGVAGLWLRQDGDAGVLQFDNMAQRGPRGTTDWTEYSIELPLAEGAREAVFGALLSGNGKVWVDDLRLLVDGESVDEAEKEEGSSSILETDREFDEGSGITVDRLSDTQTANLALLGKVWGFLKYHHPRITAGELHWDYELLRVLPLVLAAPGPSAGNAALFEWASGLGEPPPCEPCAEVPEEPHLSPQLEWIHDRESLGGDLSGYLQAVYRNRHSGGKQFYMSLHPGVGNPDIANEKAYAARELPDAGFRLLALYRFWNLIQYWFPYRDVIGEDWDRVLEEFVAPLALAEDVADYRLAFLALIARVNDTHANLWSSLDARPPLGACVLPVHLRCIEGKFVVVDRADASALEVGDVLLALDGKPVEELVTEVAPYYAASNEPTRLRDIARSLTRGEGGPCRLRVQRDGRELEVETERRPPGQLGFETRWSHDLAGETFRLLSDEVAYLKLSSVESAKAAEYVEAARGTRGLVIDIRNYPSEFVVFELGSRLVSERTPFAVFTVGSLSNPGAFVWRSPVALAPQTPRYEGRVVILVDESSQSQAEYTAMALRVAPGALVVGSTTAGADGNVSPIPIPGGLRTMISGIGVFYPDETPTQRIGIVPDVEARPTIEGIRAGRDEVLEEALRQILGESAADEEIVRMAKG